MNKFIAISFIAEKASFKDIEILIQETKPQTLRIDRINIDSTVINQLQLIYDDLLIHKVEWSNTLIIQSSISKKEVLDNINGFLRCIQEFDLLAHDMMQLMANTYQLDLNNSKEIYDLKRNRSEKQRGIINKDWDYYFHGAECAFSNNKTGQYLDVKIIYGTEYGVIDTYFLLRFINTTKNLKEFAKILDDKEENMQKVLDVLESYNFLVELPNQTYKSLLLNKKRDNTV